MFEARTDDEHYSALILAMGMVLGSLQVDGLKARLAESMAAGRLSAGYVAMLRDELSSVLERAEASRIRASAVAK
ncbi:MAG: hypothetical protein JWN86_713 [Planctomycetota bacterium]|nr:hypothetical protein [Planctomycetota bacterium]